LTALKDDFLGGLCPKWCEHTVATELILHPNGTQERVGELAHPLCASCPERNANKKRIRHVEIRLDRRERFKFGDAARIPAPPAAMTGEQEPEAVKRAPETHDHHRDDDHDPVLAQERRRQEREDREHAEAQRRARPRSSQSGINPGDFGL
jgi:hypothetical protein